MQDLTRLLDFQEATRPAARTRQRDHHALPQLRFARQGPIAGRTASGQQKLDPFVRDIAN